MAIEFYRANAGPYGAFSNLFKREVEFDKRVFPTAEHAYQYGKAKKAEVREWLMSAPSPALLAMAAHGLYPWDIVRGWSGNKVPRMRAVLEAKFAQHDDLRALLLSTGDEDIIELATVDSEVNRFWGNVLLPSGERVGRNMLGILLMDLRTRLQ